MSLRAATRVRRRPLTALSVLAGAATLVASAIAGSGSNAAGPSSSFTGTNASGGSPSSSFSGSGTSSGSGGEGSGSDDSGSFGGEGGDGGTLGVAGFGPGGAAGMTVASVRRLQAELARLGYFHHVVTGYYGLVTLAAVKQFQRSAGLKSDGIWGPRSEAALKRRLTGG